MKEYLLILRDHEVRWDAFSAEEVRSALDLYAQWNQRLREEERFAGAGKLRRELGVTVRSKDGDIVVDGPYAEAKEAIGGYYCILAEDLEDATRAARGCPILTYGGSVEVRELEGTVSPA